MMSSLLVPAPDFSQPLELLSACHQRIEGQCDTMLRLLPHCREHGSDAAAQKAAAAVLKYFSSAAVHHHQDEEQDLLPTLTGLLQGEQAVRAAVLCGDLVRQHRELEAAWASVRPWLEAVAHGQAAELEESVLQRLAALYRCHIQLEEHELLPLCRQAFDAPRLAVLGRSMAQRRGVAWPPAA